MSTTKWKILHNETERRAEDYTSTITLLNMGAGTTVTVTLTQKLHGSASDLVNALRALTQSLMSVVHEPAGLESTPAARMH